MSAQQETPASARYATVGLHDLRVGITLRAPIYDTGSDKDVLLLSAGAKITPRQLEILRQRGVSHVRVLRSEMARVTRCPGASTAAAGSQESAAPPPFVESVAQRSGPTTYERKALGQAREFFKSARGQTEELFQGLFRGDVVDGEAILAAAYNTLMQMAEDLDLFVSLGIAIESDGKVYTQSVQTSRLAMAVGAMLGLDRDQLIELGIGCMVHDAGMLRLNPRICGRPRRLTPIEFLEITKHPVYTFEMIKDVRELPMASRMVAYQIHERINGTGYPRQRQGRQIHPLARIASVADEFIGKISPRSYRRPLLPYAAMAKVLADAGDGLFDSDAVRGLLRTVSLFPVGSYVEMSDGRLGRVIRANGEHYTRPVIELWDPNDPSAAVEVVDMTAVGERSDLQIVRPHNPAGRLDAAVPAGPQSA